MSADSDRMGLRSRRSGVQIPPGAPDLSWISARLARGKIALLLDRDALGGDPLTSIWTTSQDTSATVRILCVRVHHRSSFNGGITPLPAIAARCRAGSSV